jgi:A/G-specific adenine glycosylase
VSRTADGKRADAATRRRLLAWFRKNARSLPWRETRDPYRIWISEVMLQQTQVAAVIPYFHRFLARYPDLPSLAAAHEQAVLRLWEGLGYYRRARDLLRAARQLADAGHATIPDNPELVRALPGFGRYTTNAVLSQAYDRRLPILEANSQRVLCRLFGIAKDPKERAVQKRLWKLAERLLPSKSVGDFNQAMMELGALVCTPAKPGCTKCPLRSHCRANLQERQEQIPTRTPPVAAVAVEEVAVIVQRRGQFLLVQRPEGGRWANMWEFPHHARGREESTLDAAERLLAALGIAGAVGDLFATIRHTVTRFHIRMVCLRVRHRRGSIRHEAYRKSAWVRPEELHDYPLSTPQRKLAQQINSLMSASAMASAKRRKPGQSASGWKA